MEQRSVEAAADEVVDAELGDIRRNPRVRLIVRRLAENPGATVAEAMVTPAEVQAAYQFLNRDDVKAESIVAAHAACTLARSEEQKSVLFLHDTTDFSFGGRSQREGLGRLNDGGQGFRAHLCIAVTPERLPLGAVAWQTLAREGKKKPKRAGRNVKRDDRESLRWHALVQRTAELAAEHCSPVHVMDSEADDYDLLALLQQLQERFVVRAAQDRKLLDDTRLKQSLAEATVHLEREVQLSERAPKETRSRSKRNQPRKARLATLELSSRSVSLKRPSASSRNLSAALALNVVHVREVNAPEGCEPVDWILLTSEPIDSAEAVARVVDAYRARWTIEEFFKVLKTGCGFEKSQLESRGALEKLLAMLLPVAWQLLLLRSAAGADPKAPATRFLTRDQLTVLGALPDAKLARSPTVADALAALARLGGHLKHNGPPGWIVLGRAMRKVNDGVVLLAGLLRRDQS